MTLLSKIACGLIACACTAAPAAEEARSSNSALQVSTVQVADSSQSAQSAQSAVASGSAAAAVSAQSSAAALPPYEFPFHDGLYASAAGYLSIKDVCLPCQKVMLLDVPGFCERFPVHAVVQDSAAPLVVILLGIEGRPDEDFNKLWASWYAEAGYHVLTFDSTFTQQFNARSHHGVVGNVWEETGLVARIIAAFAAHECMAGKVSKLGVVGMSYGGIEALMLGTMVSAHKLPFEVQAIQSYSPPISLQRSAAIVDGWHTETQGRYTLVELQKLRNHQPDRACPETPIKREFLKAAAAASFRLTLPALIAYNDQEYCLNLLRKGDEFDDSYVRADYASRWSFTKFAFGMSYPYWMRKLNATNLEVLVHAADLAVLLAHQPPSSEIILAEDDPLDSPADMQAFKTQTAGLRVTVLPHGGHLGYVGESWTRAKLMTLFK